MLTGLGFSSLSASLWPYINIIVPHEKLGSVNGFIASAESGMLGTVVLLTGRILQYYGYFSLFLLLLINLYIAFFFSTQFIIFYGKGFKGIDDEESYENKKAIILQSMHGNRGDIAIAV